MGAVERHAAHAKESAGAAESHVQAARKESAAAQAHATAAREAAAPVELRLNRAVEAAATADRHADRAAEHARTADGHLETLAQAQAAAERLAARAEAAAAAAEQAVAEARRHAELESSLPLPDWSTTSKNGDPGDSRRPLIARRGADRPPREARAGFDDVARPMASIRLDGHFGDINPAFSELVGYAEQEFQAASWPPVADRANLSKHREQLQRMLAGEIESARVDTGYVHAQGLLVPVVGQLSLVREDGQPCYFLLEVEAG